MHKIQAHLLMRLKERNGQRFSTLCQGYTAYDNILYHLKQLLKRGWIEKKGQRYFLTPEGVRAVAKVLPQNLELALPKIFYVGFVCATPHRILLKEHYTPKGKFYNLPSGKPLFGEPLEKALVRLFKEGTGLDVPFSSFSFISLHLKTVKSSEGEVLFDDAFTVYRVILPNKEKEKIRPQKGWLWIRKKDIPRLSCWPEVKLCALAKSPLKYLVYTVFSDYVLG